MSELKLTDWFDPGVEPVRLGVYQRREDEDRIVFSFWDGECWHMGRKNIAEANHCQNTPSLYQALPWRGVLKE
jgi:hypothetical protein